MLRVPSTLGSKSLRSNDNYKNTGHKNTQDAYPQLSNKKSSSPSTPLTTHAPCFFSQKQRNTHTHKTHSTTTTSTNKKPSKITTHQKKTAQLMISSSPLRTILTQHAAKRHWFWVAWQRHASPDSTQHAAQHLTLFVQDRWFFSTKNIGIPGP